MIERIFYPVGQGAFYVEKHGDKNIVYDCGSSTFEAKESDKKKKRIIADAFSKEEEIDILFISHFHEDHVNMIPFLKDRVKKIKKVVLPLLSPDEIFRLSCFYILLGNDFMSKFVLYFRDYFDDDTEFIYVGSFEEANMIEFREWSGKEYKFVKNRTTISLESRNGTFDWIFVPYNFEKKKRRPALFEEFKKQGVCLRDLIKDPNIILGKIDKEKERANIRKIYKKLEGGIHSNSMMLYSGPDEGKNAIFFSRVYPIYIGYKYFIDPDYLRFPEKAGCIYSGDIKLTKKIIDNFVKPFNNRVGTIQIPHHGSDKNYNRYIFEVLNERPLVCPISFGKENRYRHPSTRIIIDILCNNSFPVLVTEDIDTLCVELIDYYPFG
ncbi:MBL fold metallo-hydrolase [Porphyromonas gingivalis]|uniref:MBL fold metallo-hydrolase n=1 Tax=Porphyromonas gingivalis TaxID=837 RepID=UPI0009750729|nr:MBL fold metallo-hydrolase [Porphyromonas gingivalis]MDP0531844.1 MBL fold metallo-hydrolase [Porphyromonas gingivalis]MDP0625245.1 MBL fold metallo-hydrolase [Porphyromonas gingivalis]WKD52073.1 MBL fold metallo-hydrolase [Porphyromonas gingivalis]WKD54124.1 MBL fold metallo-hydrolase [Porphyromonas gingivalis]SJL24021.1 Metallo-beta-lactamase superfamily protein [Porphyromonas gingivalis]